MSPSHPGDVRRPPPSPEGIILRVMKSSDVPQVRALHRTLLPVAYPSAFFVQLLLNPRHLCLVATEIQTGSIVGFGSAAIDVSQPTSRPNRSYTDDDRHHADQGPSDIPRSRITLLTLGVTPPYQRLGIGRSLVHGVVQRLEASFSTVQPCLPVSGHDPNEEMDTGGTVVLVQVHVANANSAGKCFYAHLGMIRQRVTDDPRLQIAMRTSLMAGMLNV